MADMVFLTRLKPEPMGAYDASVAYGVNSLVMSEDGAAAYLSIKDVPAGTPLTNTEYWKVHTDLSGMNSRLMQVIRNLTNPVKAAGNPIRAELVGGIPFDEVATRLMPVQAGEGDPSPENIRPITGHTAASLTRCGKQLCNLPDVSEATHSGIVWNCENGAVKAKGTATADEYSASAGVYYDLPVIAGQYYISGSSGNLLVYAIVTPAGSTSSKIYTNKAFTLDGTESRVRICCFVASGETVDATVYPMLNAGDTALLWEPWQGDTYTLDFGQTIYGGTMNWQTGELAVDWKMVSLTGGEAWVYYSDATYPYWYMSIDTLGSVVNSADDVCSHFQNVNISSASDNTGFSVYNPSAGNYARLGIRPKIDGVNDLDTFKAYLAAQSAAGTPVQVAYKLVASTTIQLTPQELAQLEGMNTLYGDGTIEIIGRQRMDIPLIARIEALESAILNA